MNGDVDAGVTEADPTDASGIEVAVIGAGPAGLSATLNLVRARRRTLLIDSNRPRNAATFHSHGFITRDGISPVELRKLARQELEEYPHYEYHQALVTSVSVSGAEGGFRISTKGAGLSKDEYLAQTVVIATGLTEIQPELPTLRAFYGTSIQSCIECYGYTASGESIALIAGPATPADDLAERAVLLSRFSDDTIVFSNGTGEISDADARALTARGIRIDPRPLVDVAGDRTGLTGVMLADGETVPRTFAFVSPGWDPRLGFADPLGLELDASGLIVIDGAGRTSVAGVYAAGESSAPGAQQLIVAAGEGARVASRLNRDLLGLTAPR